MLGRHGKPCFDSDYRVQRIREWKMDASLPTEGPELFFGLIGAVGTDLKAIGSQLSTELCAAGYQPHLVRVTDQLLKLPEYEEFGSIGTGPEDKRIDTLMTLGDRFRKEAKRGDAVVLLGIADVQDTREKRGGLADVPLSSRQSYIIHSLKNPNEVTTLRAIYGSSFIAISVYSPRLTRLENLCKRIAASHNVYDSKRFEDVAVRLIERDERERGEDFGQNVEGTFPLADFFINAVDASTIRDQISRLIDILFRYPYATPTQFENGMFHAKAVALRSADLSRQVGAVIATSEGEIVCTGCNEVPKAGGGSVWAESGDPTKDYRDYKLGYDPTSQWKRAIVTEIFQAIQKDWFNEQHLDSEPEALASEALRTILKGTRADSVLEFGRIVHAEMAALMDASRRGLSVKDQTMFCTTFPCHMCARHLMNAGLKSVVYIEPYPKSLTKDLYKRSVRIDLDYDSDGDALGFQPFVGVAPRRYIDFFEMDGWIKRKDRNGRVLEWSRGASQPRVNSIQSYGAVENAHLKQISLLMKQKGASENE
jgi:cytidine deaminase